MAGLAKTKTYFRFAQRCDYYEVDLELCDLLVSDFVKIADTKTNLAVALGATKDQYPRLGQANTKRTRQVRGGHLKRTLYASFIKDLYEDFVEFLAETMERAALKGVDPGLFAGSVKLDMDAKDLLSIGSWDGVISAVSTKVFRALENERKTVELIKKATVRLGLSVDPALIEAAMPYLDARHMLVHQDGRADAFYKDKYPSVSIREGKIVLDFAFAMKARQSIDALSQAIDAEIIAANLVRPEHMCP